MGYDLGVSTPPLSVLNCLVLATITTASPEGLSIVEATLRFDTFRGEQNRGEPARLPEMRHVWSRKDVDQDVTKIDTKSHILVN